MSQYFAVFTNGADGGFYNFESLVAQDYEEAKKEAIGLTLGLSGHDVVHLCRTEPGGDYHSVAARVMCSDRWIESYAVH